MLAPEEMDAWMPFACVLNRLPAALDAQLQRDAGISHFEYMVLAVLADAPRHELRMSDLASVINSSLSRLSHVVTRLEQQGWVRRMPCPENGRYIKAILTDAGLDKVLATAPGHAEAVRDLVLDTLTTRQVKHLRDISRRIHARVAAPLTNAEET